MYPRLRLLHTLLVAVLSSSSLAAYGQAATNGSDDFDSTRFLDQGRIGIYRARQAMVSELRAEIATITSEHRELAMKYKANHPRLMAVSKQLDVLRKEMEIAKKGTRKSIALLSTEERATLTELYQTELELAAAKNRAVLASLRTRYKEKYPSVLETKTKLDALERALEAFDQCGIDRIAADPLGFERIQLQSQLIDQNAELEKLRVRYRDKHPAVLRIKNRISSLERELHSLNERQDQGGLSDSPSIQSIPEPPSGNEKDKARIALLKEEIALVESHLKRIESDAHPRRQDLHYQNQTRLELLQLRQSLAAQEGRSTDVAANLEQQATLLNALIASSTSPDDAYPLQRQLISIKRAQLEFEE